MSIQWIIGLIILGVIIVFFLLWIAARRRRRGGGDEREVSQNNQVYIGNLPYRISEYDLKSHFMQYGNIRDVRIVKNSHTGRSRGYGFVTFTTNREAHDALDSHGLELKGRKIVVRIAKPQ